MIARPSFFTMKFIFIFLILSLIAIPAIASEPNSEEDPYLIEAKGRKSAATPMPQGFMIGLSKPISGGVSDDASREASMPFELVYYIDSWQFAFSSKEYGNVASVLFRNDINRDDYSGYFIEMGYGADLKYLKFDEDDFRESNVKNISVPAYILGFGSKSQMGYDKETSFSYYSGYSGGLYFVPENEDVFYYSEIEIGFGMRIPIYTSSAYFQLGGNLGMSPLYQNDFDFFDDYDDYDEMNFDFKIYYGINFKFIYSFNFNS